MKISFILIGLAIMLLPFSIANSQETTLDNSGPDRVSKCCQRILENTKDGKSEKQTQCRFSSFTCESLNNLEEIQGKDYKTMEGSCIDLNGNDVGESYVFIDGSCDKSNINDGAIGSYVTKVANNAGYSKSQSSPNAITFFIGKIIRTALGFTSLIFLIFTVYSGVQWMTAGGNSDRVSSAQKRLVQSVIGMAITSIAYVAANLIINIIASAS